MEFALYFMVGVATGLLNGVASGGGLISIPALLFMGVSPIVTIATTKLSAVGSATSSVVRFHKEDNVIQWKYLPILICIAVFAGIVGPRLVIQVDESTVETIIAVLLLALAPLLLYYKSFGVAVSKKRHKKREAAGYIVYGLTILYAAMFGAGAGIFSGLALMYFFNMTTIQANATLKVSGAIGLLVAVFTFTSKGLVDYSVGIPLLLGSLTGGNIGARIALLKGAAWVKYVVVAIMIVSGTLILLF